jgi:predicted transcriptional regulator
VWETINDGGIRREYNTVMTTLNRLCQKGLAKRANVPNSRAFRYIPRHRDQAEWQREVAMETLKNLLGMDAIPMPLSLLVEAISEHDPRLLDDLQRLVDERRSGVKP